MKRNPKTPTKSISKPVRSMDVPATSAMLYEMEERLNHRMDSGLSSVKAELHRVDSGLSSVKAELHRVALLVEEQNSRNKYAMDGYTQIYEMLSNFIRIQSSK